MRGEPHGTCQQGENSSEQDDSWMFVDKEDTKDDTQLCPSSKQKHTFGTVVSISCRVHSNCIDLSQQLAQ